MAVSPKDLLNGDNERGLAWAFRLIFGAIMTTLILLSMSILGTFNDNIGELRSDIKEVRADIVELKLRIADNYLTHDDADVLVETTVNRIQNELNREPSGSERRSR